MRRQLRLPTIASLLSMLALAAGGSGWAQPKPATKSGTPAKARTAPKQKQGGGMSLSPARLDLTMAPGSSKTFVVRVMHGSAGPKAKTARLQAKLNDWRLNSQAQVEYAKPGTIERSAAPWVVYSPAEMAVPPGRAHSIRVTVTVPQNAKPGDHTTALVVAPRQSDLRRLTNKQAMVFRFRLASIIYVRVPPLRPKPSLRGLQAKVVNGRVVITSTLRNDGNSLVRPLHSAQVLDQAGKVVAKHKEAETLPVLAGQTLRPSLVIDEAPPKGRYSVRYRIDFRHGKAVVEGRTKLTVQ